MKRLHDGAPVDSTIKRQKPATADDFLNALELLHPAEILPIILRSTQIRNNYFKQSIKDHILPLPFSKLGYDLFKYIKQFLSLIDWLELSRTSHQIRGLTLGITDSLIIYGVDWTFLEQFSSLTELVVDCSLDSLFLRSVGKIKSLRKLALGQYFLHHRDLRIPDFSHLSHLTSLILCDPTENTVGPLIMKPFQKLKSLTHLDIGDIGRIDSVSHLSVLNLQELVICISQLLGISTLKSLKSVVVRPDLSDDEDGDEPNVWHDYREFFALESLTHLDTPVDEMEGMRESVLKGLTRLRSLTIEGFLPEECIGYLSCLENLGTLNVINLRTENPEGKQKQLQKLVEKLPNLECLLNEVFRPPKEKIVIQICDTDSNDE